MANPTTNYGWPMPTSTDLVTDLPADFAAFGQPVDTSLKALNPETTLGDIAYRSATANTNTRLPIGTTGQVLTVAGGVPTWATGTAGDIEGVTAGVGISGGGTSGTVTVTNSMATAIDAKGDLVAGTGADAFSRLGVGANNTVLTADSAQATGLKWATPAGSSLSISQLATGSLSGTSTTLASSLSSYDFLMVVVTGFVSASNSNFYLTLNNNTTDNYSYVYNVQAGTTVTQSSYDTTTEGFPVTYWDQSLASNTSNQVVFTLQNCKSAGFTTMIKHSRYVISGPTNITEAGQGIARFSAAVSSLELKSGSAATGGTFYVFGG